MSLRAKAWLTTLTVLGVLLLLLYGVFSLALQRSFADLQRSFARHSTEQAVLLLGYSLSSIGRVLVAYSQWDGTYAYVTAPTPEFEKANFQSGALPKAGIHLVLIYDAEGRLVYSWQWEPATGEVVPVLPELVRLCGEASDFLKFAPSAEANQTLAAAGGRIVMMVSRPILRSDGTGPSRGTMVFGQFLTPSVLREMQAAGKLQFELRALPPLPRAPQAPEEPGTFDPREWLKGLGVTVETPLFITDEPVVARARLPDLSGERRIELAAVIPDTVQETARRHLRSLLGLLGVAGIGFAALMIIAMEVILLNRLDRTSRRARQIAERGDLAERLPVQGHDEVASLSRSINTMLGALQSAQATLLASRERARRQNDALIAISRSRAVHLGEVVAAFAQLTEAGARTLNVGRASVWMFEDEGRTLACKDLYEAAASRHSPGPRLDTATFPRYCADIRASRFVAVADAASDPRVAELLENYTKPLGIGAFLDVSIKRDDQTCGVVCFEHLGGPREWTDDERNFASSLADAVALALDVAERHGIENELRAAKDAAESANRAKSEFLANMSHEIRTPLNSVLGFSELLHEKIREPQLRTYLDAIASGGRTLLHLIDDILDLSKIEAGHLEIQPAAVEVRKLVEEVAAIFQRKAEQRGVALSVEIDPDMPPVFMLDELRLRQVLFNLVGNAVKFTEEGSVHLGVESMPGRSPDLAHLTFAVQDTGIGIPPEDHHRIFEAFSQQTGQSTRQFGGTGLGLAITQRLVRAMGGSITVESDRHQGSLFQVHFRDVPVSAAVPSVPADVPPAPAAFEPALVLVVDDVPHNRELAQGLLESRGLRVITAENGAEGVALARADPRPRVVLMDLKMPVMNGFEAARKIKADPATRGIILIAVTASSRKEDDALIAKAGFDAFLRKPFRKEQLFHLLSRYLRRLDAPAAAPDGGPSLPPASLARPLSPAKRSAWAGARHRLLDTWPAQAQELRGSLIVSRVRALAAEISETARQIDAPPVADFAVRLSAAAERFDAEDIAALLDSLPVLCQATAAEIDASAAPHSSPNPQPGPPSHEPAPLPS